MAPALSVYSPTTSPKLLMPCASVNEIDVQRIDDERIAVADFDVAELLRREIDESSDDLAQVVDAVGEGVAAICVGIVEVGVGAAAQEEAVCVAASIVVRADHLARGVDAGCKGAVRGQGIIEGDESAAVGVVEEAV